MSFDWDAAAKQMAEHMTQEGKRPMSDSIPELDELISLLAYFRDSLKAKSFTEEQAFDLTRDYFNELSERAAEALAEDDEDDD